MHNIWLMLLILFIFFILVIIPFIDMAANARYDHKWDEYIKNKTKNEEGDKYI